MRSRNVQGRAHGTTTAEGLTWGGTAGFPENMTWEWVVLVSLSLFFLARALFIAGKTDDLAQQAGLKVDKVLSADGWDTISMDFTQRKLLLHSRGRRTVIGIADVLGVSKDRCEVTISISDPGDPTFRFTFKTELGAQECVDSLRALAHPKST
jgi:hypothetical protein